jgi:hypothetical protein
MKPGRGSANQTDISRRNLREWFEDLTPAQLCHIGGTLVGVIVSVFLFGYWLGQHDSSRTIVNACTHSNYRLDGQSLPAPGRHLELRALVSHLEWDPGNCRATVQAYFNGQIVFTGELASPAALTLHQLGDYEVKLWDSRRGVLLTAFLVRRT